jgi:hypothetical protein
MIGEIKLRMVETGNVKFFSICAQERGAETPTRTEDDDFHFVVAAAVSGGRTNKLPVRTPAATTRRIAIFISSVAALYEHRFSFHSRRSSAFAKGIG